MKILKIPVVLEFHFCPSRAVDGEIVDIAPHLASVATFVVHRNPRRHFRPNWQISNVESGFRVGGPDYYTKADAIIGARIRLIGKTVDDILRQYRKYKVK